MDTILEAAGLVAVIEFLGDSLDVTNADSVEGRLSRLVSDNPRVVADLRWVTFLDSAGCGALMAAHRLCRDLGGDLRVCHAAGEVKTVLDVARVSRIVPVHPTREQAVAAFS